VVRTKFNLRCRAYAPFHKKASGEDRGDSVVLRFDDPNLARMATITLHESAALEGLQLGGAAEMY
jgi:hypothetical protein